MKLSGNTVLITGGGSGIGLALALAFQRMGNVVVICGRTDEKLRVAAAESPDLQVISCDIRDPAQVERMGRILEDDYPGLNVLVNNAGVQYHCNFLDDVDRRAAIQDEILINLTGQILVTERLLPLLLSQPEAAIVNVTSALALIPKKSAPIYCAAKAGLHNFTRTLRYQLADTAVRVFEVIPDVTETGMTRGRGGQMLSPAAVADKTIAGLGRDQERIAIARTKLLLLLYRIWPGMAYRLTRDQ